MNAKERTYNNLHHQDSRSTSCFLVVLVCLCSFFAKTIAAQCQFAVDTGVKKTGKAFLWIPPDSEAFHKACLAIGIDSEYILWPDARHAFIVPEYTASDAQISQAILAIDRFLVKHRIFEKGQVLDMP